MKLFIFLGILGFGLTGFAQSPWVKDGCTVQKHDENTKTLAEYTRDLGLVGGDASEQELASHVGVSWDEQKNSILLCPLSPQKTWTVDHSISALLQFGAIYPLALGAQYGVGINGRERIHVSMGIQTSFEQQSQYIGLDVNVFRGIHAGVRGEYVQLVPSWSPYYNPKYDSSVARTLYAGYRFYWDRDHTWSSHADLGLTKLLSPYQRYHPGFLQFQVGFGYRFFKKSHSMTSPFKGSRPEPMTPASLSME